MYSILKTFLIFLGYMPEVVYGIRDKNIISSDISIDNYTANIPRITLLTPTVGVRQRTVAVRPHIFIVAGFPGSMNNRLHLYFLPLIRACRARMQNLWKSNIKGLGQIEWI